MDLDALAEQWKGRTLSELIQHHYKSTKHPVLRRAIAGTYDELPDAFKGPAKRLISEYTLARDGLFMKCLTKVDLSVAFVDFLQRVRQEAAKSGVGLSDGDLFNVFNLMIMESADLAFRDPAAKTSLGFKRGWFS